MCSLALVRIHELLLANIADISGVSSHAVVEAGSMTLVVNVQ